VITICERILAAHAEASPKCPISGLILGSGPFKGENLKPIYVDMLAREDPLAKEASR
jgi:hypothetical protein